MVSPAAVEGAINLASQVIEKVKNNKSASATVATMKGETLVSVSNVGRVEPLVMLDNDCTNQPYISDVMQSVQSIFSGYYLQAVNMVNTIADVSVKERLAPFNPGQGLGFESHSTLGRVDKKWKLLSGRKARGTALEAADNKNADTDLKQTNYASVSDKGLENVPLAANLSVGKMYNVTLRSDSHCITVPISIRLLVNIIPSTMLSKLFTYRDGFDMSLKERWHAWREGRLSFIKDLLLCQDLIDKYRRMAITDKSGIGEKILNREAGIVKNMLGGTASLATATNIAVISDKTLGLVEGELNGRFTNTKVRRAIFDNTNLMLLVVVDTEWDRVTIYTRGLDSHTTLSVKDMKAANKDGGPDVAEIMRAYMLGSAPQSL